MFNYCLNVESSKCNPAFQFLDYSKKLKKFCDIVHVHYENSSPVINKTQINENVCRQMLLVLKESGSVDELLLITGERAQGSPRARGALEGPHTCGPGNAAARWGPPTLRRPRPRQRGPEGAWGGAELWEDDCLILKRPNTPSMATCCRGRRREHRWHAETGPSLPGAGGVRLRRHSAAAEAARAAARCCRGWPAGRGAGITGRCWRETLTVRFRVQVKSFFLLILLFVPLGLPPLL